MDWEFIWDIPGRQNAQGHLLGHVRDLGVSSTDPNVRIYQTRERQTFHTDSADVVGLLCLKTAKLGGTSPLVSALSIFNEMRKQRPDLLHLLLQPIATDRRGEVPMDMQTVFPDPGLQLRSGLPLSDLSTPIHRLGLAFSRSPTTDGTARRSAEPF